MNMSNPVRLFGPGIILDQHGEVIAMRSRKQLAMLAYLAVEHQTVHSRESLMALLWPDEDTASAQNNLRVTLSRLRELAVKIATEGESPTDMLLVDRRTVQLHPAWVDHVDTNRFLQLMERTHRHAHSQRGQCPHCQPLLIEAVQHYQGDFLTGFGLNDCADFEEWVVIQRERLRMLVIEAYADLATYAETIEDLDAASGYVQQQIELDSLREPAYRQQMRIYAKQGQRSAALAAFERCRNILRETLGIEPEPETQHLYAQLQSALRQPAAAIPSRKHNLPAPLTRFFGRERDLATLIQQLSNPQNRMITLTGSGGVGKTRLALQIAHQVVDAFTDGVWLTELTASTDALSVTQAIASALSIREQSGTALLQTLLAAVRDKHLLLVLDNCEQVRDDCATLVAQMLAAASKLTVLATSRLPLRIDGEIVHRVPSLALPNSISNEHKAHEPDVSIEILLTYAAVQLFVDRATSVQTNFALHTGNAAVVVQLCHRLDGIPLALELAAARVNVMPLDVLAQRLDKHLSVLTSGNPAALPRHRTLHALVAWSYNLLSESQQALLRQLSVFAGGWTLEAAEAICDANSKDTVLDDLIHLVDHSLVVFGHSPEQSRYTLLETIRQFAEAQFQQADEVHAAQARHAHYYANLVAQAAAQTNSPTYQHALNQIELERANVFGALGWAIAHEADLALRLEVSLGGEFNFWEMRGHFDEGRNWQRQLLAATQDQLSTNRAKVLLDAVWLERAKPDYAQALIYAQASQKLSDELGDAFGSLDARMSAANIRIMQGDVATNQALLRDYLVEAERLGHRRAVLRGLNSLGLSHYDLHEFEPAKKLFERCLNLYQEQRNALGEADAIHHLALILDNQGDSTGAIGLYERAEVTYRELGFRRSVALVQNNMGYALMILGQYERARRLFIDGLLIRREMGLRLGYVYSFVNFGCLAAFENELARAAQLLGASEALREHIGFPNDTFELDTVYMNAIASARNALGETRFNLEWSRGRGLTAEQAIELALETYPPIQPL